jgi:hypothetical protein
MYLICPNCGLMREARMTTVHHTCGRCRARGENVVYLTLLPSLQPRDQRFPTVVREDPTVLREDPRRLGA